MAPPAGSLPIQEGALKLPEGTTALPEGTFKDFDADGNVIHLDRQGNILEEDGTLKQHHTGATKENPTDGASVRSEADSPLPRTPAEQSTLVGAGTRGGSDTVRLGSDLGDTGRIGEDLARTGDDAPNLDRAPGGTANNLPTNSVDSTRPAGGNSDDAVSHSASARDERPDGRATHTGPPHLDAHSPSGEVHEGGPGGGDRHSGNSPGWASGERPELPGPRHGDGPFPSGEPQPFERGGKTEKRIRENLRGSRVKPRDLDKAPANLAGHRAGGEMA
ncbi:hypothetical protein [Streptomyces sp. NPDC054874]